MDVSLKSIDPRLDRIEKLLEQVVPQTTKKDNNKKRVSKNHWLSDKEIRAL
ncbi:hypothetical protein [Maribacter sp.]|uniref:hypothetical protein n=1 Tax=Maribacter sp. TaxID=1897614 RepID=UPI00329A58A8